MKHSLTFRTTLLLAPLAALHKTKQPHVMFSTDGITWTKPDTTTIR